MNKLYSLIMSVKSKQYAATLDPDYKEISDKESEKTLCGRPGGTDGTGNHDGDLNLMSNRMSMCLISIHSPIWMVRATDQIPADHSEMARVYGHESH